MLNLLTFFTTWSFVIILFHKQIYQSIHLVYLTYITCIIGTYLSYYNPKYFDFMLFGKSYKVEGLNKLLLADSLHFIPFIFIYCLYNQYYKKNYDGVRVVNAIIIILIYVVLLNIERVYYVAFKELFIVFVIANVLFFALI